MPRNSVLRAYRTLIGVLAVVMTASAAEPPQLAGLLRDSRLTEVSGMAASSRDPDLLWVANDSGNHAELFAISRNGTLRARVVVSGVKAVDWEDLAAFEWEGNAYLLIGDVGDNGGVRPRSELIIVPEPVLPAGRSDGELAVTPAWRTRFHFADAPHDVEAVNVDTLAGEVLLLTKRTAPPQLWSVPLKSASADEQTAIKRADLSIPEEPYAPVDFHRRLLPGRPTALTLSRDGRRAAVLSYASVWLYQRAQAQSWAQVFARPPEVFPIALLAQAEAIAFSNDGSAVYVTGERWPAPLLRLTLPALAAPTPSP